ncbi:MAG: polyprenyl synthetase family protein [Bacteriovoracaceae bacterium]|nr:polyprenyl synthetase family protein [Bacteriovoracaceae bacterium]
MIDFDKELQLILKRYVKHPEIHTILDYATRPPGKLFRPRLLEALAHDLKITDLHDVKVLGCALEIHHAYSLVHDDLPSMDNDDVRRGKPSTHKAFGEWKALLAGDALLCLSFELLENLKTKNASLIRKFFHWSTGARGLILGQWIDLGLEGQNNARHLMRMHELKTARLMQIACVGAMSMSSQKSDLKSFMRLGQDIGLAFQLLDDLDDLNSEKLSDHELQVNPFLLAPKESAQKLSEMIHRLDTLKLPHTRSFLQSFLKTSAKGLIENEKYWVKRVGDQSAGLKKLLTSGICA